MKTSWKLIPKIVEGEKTIESRWYQTKRTPWNTVSVGDVIYFKNSGEPVTASAKVTKVMQFEFTSHHDAQRIIRKYGREICLVNDNVSTWGKLPKYCILMFLEDARYIQPFNINKKGFGSAAAWISINDIKDIWQIR